MKNGYFELPAHFVDLTDPRKERGYNHNLLDTLNLKGAVITADAMHCQKATAKNIIEKEADYVLQVKEN